MKNKDVTMSLPTKAKVVIIGGGIHGLSTAITWDSLISGIASLNSKCPIFIYLLCQRACQYSTDLSRF